jgi:hypothetical protein
MIEFGSDFHYIDSYNSGRAHLTDVFRGAMLLADGRQCIVVLIRQYGWKRIWMPDYFCYEVIDTIKEQTGIKVMFYEDNPLHEGQVENLPFEEGDVLLRMNFFGMRGQRNNKKIPCPVIEDHTHDPFGHWALYSDADWCISSIRKILPLPEGGMMWSPKGHQLTIELGDSEENEQIATTRWEGMEMKTAYLEGESVTKDEFRKRYTETEEWFDYAEPSVIDNRSRDVVSKKLDINLWQGAKRKNWLLLKSLVNQNACTVMVPEDEFCSAFSLILQMESKEQSDALRKRLIEACVYPAILWTLPEGASKSSKDFSERMLSIHCDGRYTEEDIRQLADILNYVLETR